MTERDRHWENRSRERAKAMERANMRTPKKVVKAGKQQTKTRCRLKLPDPDIIVTEEMVNHFLDSIENDEEMCKYLGITDWEE